jgi:hypothetical protein
MNRTSALPDSRESAERRFPLRCSHALCELWLHRSNHRGEVPYLGSAPLLRTIAAINAAEDSPGETFAAFYGCKEWRL